MATYYLRFHTPRGVVQTMTAFDEDGKQSLMELYDQIIESEGKSHAVINGSIFIPAEVMKQSVVEMVVEEDGSTT